MEAINQERISLKAISEATETESPKCEITIFETKIKSIINGVNLEFCVKHGTYFLVFTTDDCPFEEALNIYLFNKSGQVIDSANIFWPYGTGSFKFIKFIEPSSMSFVFFDNRVWNIEIFSKKYLYFPFFSEPSGVWRKLKLMRNFKITDITSS